MNPSRADARFLSPNPIARAVVLAESADWNPALAQADIEVGGPSPDVAIAPATRTREATATGAPTVILEGRSVEQALRREGWTARTYLALPDLEEPQAFVPIGSPVARYALSVWLPAWERWKLVRNAMAGELATRRLLPHVRRFVTIGARDSVRPFLVTAATDLGVDPNADWFFAAGHGDLLARGAFILFDPGSATPAWALKFCRLPGPDDRIDRELDALRLVSDAAGSAASRAPRFVGRIECGGYPASLETAAPGRRLNGVLSAVRPIHARRRVIERVVQWLAQVARETAADPALLEPERRRLRAEVLPSWTKLGAPADLVERLPPMPAVLQHNDLGTWNLVASGEDFTALDWESAKRHGFPLWDAFYFLADALAGLDGALGPKRRCEHFRELFLGELPSSELLLSSLTRVAEASGVSSRAMGPLATMCWLNHANSDRARRDRARIDQPHVHDAGWLGEMAIIWMSTAGLGVNWNPWRTDLHTL